MIKARRLWFDRRLHHVQNVRNSRELICLECCANTCTTDICMPDWLRPFEYERKATICKAVWTRRDFR